MGKSGGNEHEGRRQRQKNKFLNHGFDAFEQHEVLEVLLYYAIPRRDTNPMAHRLLERYGNFGRVCDAPADELERDFGLSKNAVTLLKMQPQLARIYAESKINDTNFIESETLGDLFQTKFIGRTAEAVAMLLGDARGRIIFFDIIAEGSISSTEMPIRRMVDLAIRHNAKTAFIAHNHPSGSLLPSKQDLDTTMTICDTLFNVGVRLLDHYIITDTNYLSLKDSGMADHIFLY
ncbi:MAG TPA: hypothetical protein DEO32_01240 [Ruminococcaceae bacterium]|nr:hypothetical protein [Oscillospiraceae bacterium]